MSVKTYVVPGISCSHCKTAIEGEITKLDKIENVEVDIDSKTVTVTGDATDDTLRAAIDRAGCDVAP